MPCPFGYGFWNERNTESTSRINWRASLVPAAAVIPAPIAYIKVAAVKKLVVAFPRQGISPTLGGYLILLPRP